MTSQMIDIQPDQLLGSESQYRFTNPSNLTAREIEILSMIAMGIPLKTLASELFLSIHTVRNHVHHILSKLDAHSMLEAVVVATQDGTIAFGAQYR
jgi:DNA-binding NarL/FixJ family response regulator